MTNPVQVTQANREAARAFVTALGFPQWARLIHDESDDFKDGQGEEAVAVLARHRCDRIAELEAAVTRLTLALEMERGRGQPRAEHDRSFPDLGPAGEDEIERAEVIADQICGAHFDDLPHSQHTRWHTAKAAAIAALTPARTYQQGIEDAAKEMAKYLGESSVRVAAIRALGTKP